MSDSSVFDLVRQIGLKDRKIDKKANFRLDPMFLLAFVN